MSVLQVVINALRGNAFFEHESEAKLNELAPCFRLEEIAGAGERIFEEGGPTDKLCLLLEGSCTIEVGGVVKGIIPSPDGSEANPLIGEAALLSTNASAMSVTTREPCRLLILTRPKFRRLQQLVPNIKEQVRAMSRLIGKLRDSTEGAGKFAEKAPLKNLGPTREDAAKRIQRIVKARKTWRKLRALHTIGGFGAM